MITILSKFVDWLLPERSARRSIIDELRMEIDRLIERNNKLESRIDDLEQRTAKDSCFRYDCRLRISINQLLQPKRDTATDCSIR